MRQDARRCRVAEVVAPNLFPGRAVELEEQTIVADEKQRAIGDRRTAEYRATRGECPNEFAVSERDGIKHPARGPDVRLPVAHRCRSVDRRSKLGLPFRSRPARQLGHRSFGWQ